MDYTYTEFWLGTVGFVIGVILLAGVILATRKRW